MPCNSSFTIPCPTGQNRATQLPAEVHSSQFLMCFKSLSLEVIGNFLKCFGFSLMIRGHRICEVPIKTQCTNWVLFWYSFALFIVVLRRPQVHCSSIPCLIFSHLSLPGLRPPMAPTLRAYGRCKLRLLPIRTAHRTTNLDHANITHGIVP